MARVRDICKNLDGVVLGKSPDDAIACILVDSSTGIRAVVFRDSLVIESKGFVSQLDLDEVREVHHDAKNHRLVISTRSGRIVLSP